MGYTERKLIRKSQLMKNTENVYILTQLVQELTKQVGELRGALGKQETRIVNLETCADPIAV